MSLVPQSLYPTVFTLSLRLKLESLVHPEFFENSIPREGQQSFFAFIPSKDVLGLYGSLDAKWHGVQKIPADSDDSIDLLELFRYSFVQIQKPFRGYMLENNTYANCF